MPRPYSEAPAFWKQPGALATGALQSPALAEPQKASGQPVASGPHPSASSPSEDAREGQSSSKQPWHFPFLAPLVLKGGSLGFERRQRRSPECQQGKPNTSGRWSPARLHRGLIRLWLTRPTPILGGEGGGGEGTRPRCQPERKHGHLPTHIPHTGLVPLTRPGQGRPVAQRWTGGQHRWSPGNPTGHSQSLPGSAPPHQQRAE